MAYNSYQIQPLKIDYTNLPEGIDKEELAQAAADGQQRNRLFQLITRAGDAMQPAKSALEKVIFGEQEEPKITTGEDGKTNVTVNNNRAGGLLGFANDVAKGFSENVSTPYNPNNMLPSKKGFAQRFGEGLGTATRLLDNSAVRGAIAYGLSKSLGDNNALEQGLTAASMNMAAKNNDKIYRNDLIQYEQNALMNSPEFANLAPEERQRRLSEIANKYNNIRGYIDENAYKNILASRQMQENAEWRKAQMEMTRQQNEIMNDIRRQGIAVNWAKVNKKDTPSLSNITTIRKEFSSLPAVKNANEIKRQFQNVESVYNQYKAGKLRANAADQALITTLNKILDPTSVVRESEFARTAAGQSLIDKIAGYSAKISKGGSGLTNAEREDLYNTMKLMYEANNREVERYVQDYTELAERNGINPADIMPRQYSSTKETPQPTTTAYNEGRTATNPATGERIIFRGGKWQKI